MIVPFWNKVHCMVDFWKLQKSQWSFGGVPKNMTHSEVHPSTIPVYVFNVMSPMNRTLSITHSKREINKTHFNTNDIDDWRKCCWDKNGSECVSNISFPHTKRFAFPIIETLGQNWIKVRSPKTVFLFGYDPRS